jgi:hypothetical protein
MQIRPLSRRAGLFLAALGVTSILAVVYYFAPEQYGFYPRCMFFLVTGWQCPGCGALRAAHHLLHGDLGGALQFNSLLVISLPIVVLLAVVFGYRFATGRSLPNPFAYPAWIWMCGAVAVVVAFGIWRNL